MFIETKKQLEEFVGKTPIEVIGCAKDSEEMTVRFNEGSLTFYHRQDCCENVCIEDVIGDPQDLVGKPLAMIEKATNEDAPELDQESYTWTFYKFATVNGYVTVRWLGVSSGYYSEEVDIRWEALNEPIDEIISWLEERENSLEIRRGYYAEKGPGQKFFEYKGAHFFCYSALTKALEIKAKKKQ